MAMCHGAEPTWACGLRAEHRWVSALGTMLSDTYGYEPVPLTTLVTMNVLSRAGPIHI